MAVLLPAVSPANAFTQSSAFPDQRSFTQYAIFVRIKNSVDLDFTDNDLVSNAGSFGYRLRGTSGNQLRASYRFSTTEDRFHAVTTGEYTNVILTLNRTDETVRHYFNGAQSGAAIDITGETGFFSASALKVQGSPTSTHGFEFERIAEWRDSLPTAQDIADLELGADFSSLENPPTASYEPSGPNGSYASSLTDDIGSNDMPQTEGPTSGGLEPVYSGATDSVSIDFTGRVLNRTGRTAFLTEEFTGTYTGKTPTGIEFRVQSGGSPLPGLDWQPASNVTIGVDVWSGTLGPIPVGDDYVIQIRDAGDNLTTGASGLFNVGIVILAYGQSNMTRQYAGVPTTPIVPNSNCYAYYIGSWVQLNTAIMQLANAISDRNGGISVGILCDGQGATPIADLKPGSVIWDTEVVPALATVNNQIEAINYVQGENDAGGDIVAYSAALNEINDELLLITGRDETGFTFLESQSGTDNNASSTNDSYVELRDTQKSFGENALNGKFAATTIDADKVDSLHYTNDWYVEFNNRIAKSYQNVLGGEPVDATGPELISFYIDGATLRAQVDLRGATGLAQTGTGDITGFRLWTDNTLATEVTISAAALDGDEIVITPALAPTELMTLTHLRLTNPDITNLAAGTGYDIDDIALQMGFAEFSLPSIEFDVSPASSLSQAEALGVILSAPVIFDVSVSSSVSQGAPLDVTLSAEVDFDVLPAITISSGSALSISLGDPVEFDVSAATSISLAQSLEVQIGGPIVFDVSPANTVSLAQRMPISVGIPVRIDSFTINWAN